MGKKKDRLKRGFKKKLCKENPALKERVPSAERDQPPVPEGEEIPRARDPDCRGNGVTQAGQGREYQGNSPGLSGD